MLLFIILIVLYTIELSNVIKNLFGAQFFCVPGVCSRPSKINILEETANGPALNVEVEALFKYF